MRVEVRIMSDYSLPLSVYVSPLILSTANRIVRCLQVTKQACCCTGVTGVRSRMCAGGREGQQEAEAEAGRTRR